MDETAIPTEDLRALFDMAVGSLNFTSGFFDSDDVKVLRRIAVAIGVDPMVATPTQFAVEYPHEFRPYPVDPGNPVQRVLARDRCERCLQPEKLHPDKLRQGRAR